MTPFDPNAAARPDSGIFGLPHTETEAALVYLPVPWEATTSYGGGTANGPRAIFAASRQVDLFDLEIAKPYETGLFMREPSPLVKVWNDEARPLARAILDTAGGVAGNPELEAALQRVNQLGATLNDWVFAQTADLLNGGKIVAVIGGDHSVPLGAFAAVARHNPHFGILHFDAHSDTRNAYEGFVWSHASIMRNALARIPEITRLVQVGIRDLCEEELNFCAAEGPRVRTFYDRDLTDRKFSGAPFQRIAEEIIDALPESVWISFDIDGLDPALCPHTGTPVPGGLSYHEALAILSRLARSGRRIIGFDLNEVAPNPSGEDEWDANVAARLLYKMSALTLYSQGKATLRVA